jgi:aspartate-semialdehyde dehydrogenase
MKLAVVGATGLVGSAMLRVLEARGFAFDTLIPVASAASAGREVEAAGRSWKVCAPQKPRWRCSPTWRCFQRAAT